MIGPRASPTDAATSTITGWPSGEVAASHAKAVQLRKSYQQGAGRKPLTAERSQPLRLPQRFERRGQSQYWFGFL